MIVLLLFALVGIGCVVLGIYVARNIKAKKGRNRSYPSISPRKEKNSFKKFLKILLITVIACILLSVGLVGFMIGRNNNEPGYTSSTEYIGDIEGVSKLYLMSRMVEDYELENESEQRSWFGKMLHKVDTIPHFRLATANMSCQYYIDFNQMEKIMSNDTVTIYNLPECLKTENNVHSTSFVCDDEEFWKKIDPEGLGNDIKEKLIFKTNAKWDTPEFKERALTIAERKLTELYNKIGYNTVIITGIGDVIEENPDMD